MDYRLFKKIGRVFLKFTAGMNATSTIWLFAIMFLMTGDVIGRTVFNHPIKGASELVKISIVGIVFMQIPHTLWVNRHIRSDLILSRVRPGVRHVQEFILNLFGAAVFIGIMVSSWKPMLVGWKILEYEGEGALRVPVYPIRTLIILGSAATAIIFLYRAVSEANKTFSKKQA